MSNTEKFPEKLYIKKDILNIYRGEESKLDNSVEYVRSDKFIQSDIAGVWQDASIVKPKKSGYYICLIDGCYDGDYVCELRWSSYSNGWLSTKSHNTEFMFVKAWMIPPKFEYKRK